MLVQDIAKRFPPFHEPAAKGAYLIDTGKFIQVFPTITPKQTGTLEFAAHRGPAVADTEQQPFITYSVCPACGKASGIIYGPTAHLTQKVYHCGGIVETVPAHVGARYVQLQQDFKNRQARKKRLAD